MSNTLHAPPANETGRLPAAQVTTPEANRISSLSPDQYGKPLAVALYTSGAISLERLQTAFDRRPQWRAA